VTASTSTEGRGVADDVERLAETVSEFVDGWLERVEYHVRVGPHIEARAASVRQLGLLTQLQREVSGYTPVSTGERWGQPGSRPPGTLDLLDLVHQIDGWLIMKVTQGKYRVERLRSLVNIAGFRDQEWTRETLRDLRRFRKTARIMLQYDVPAVPLRDTVCGSCGGTLVVSVDADSDVRCVGNLEQQSCGTVYERWRWVDLLGDV
jgi:hypothetical protein